MLLLLLLLLRWRQLCSELMVRGRVQYSTSVDVYAFAILVSELLSWSLSYSSGGLPASRSNSSDGGECGKGLQDPKVSGDFVQRTTAEAGTRERRDGRGREKGEW